MKLSAAARPGHRPQGAPGVPAQPLDRRGRWRSSRSSSSSSRCSWSSLAPSVSSRRARAESICSCTCSGSRCSCRPCSPPTAVAGERQQGTPRAGAHDPDPSRGVPARQGAGGPRSVGRHRLRGVRASSSAASCCSRSPRSRRRSSAGRTSSPRLLFTPLLAAWSIWVGIAISTRSSDVRVAQQLSLLASLPLVLVTSLIAFDVIHADARPGDRPGRVALLADVLGWRIVAPLFDRERLMTGPR